MTLALESQCSLSEVAQSCPTLCNSVDWGLPGSSIHEIFQARVLEWVAISFSRDLPDPGIEPGSLHYRQTLLYHLGRQGSPVLTRQWEIMQRDWGKRLILILNLVKLHFMLEQICLQGFEQHLVLPSSPLSEASRRLDSRLTGNETKAEILLPENLFIFIWRT